jgi:hypothetical protein
MRPEFLFSLHGEKKTTRPRGVVDEFFSMIWPSVFLGMRTRETSEVHRVDDDAVRAES